MTNPQKSKSREGSPANADTKTDPPIISQSLPDDKTLATLRAQFALLGHTMRVTRNTDQRRMVVVERWGYSRVFTHGHDVQAFLNQLQGAHRATGGAR